MENIRADSAAAPQFAFVGLVVSDMAASVGFYRRLGLGFAEGAEAQGHAEAALPGGLLLVLDSEETVRSFHPEWRAPEAGGRVGIAFRCAGPEQVDAVYEELVGAGYHGELKPWDAFWGQRYATVRDPDGNGVDLLAPLASGAAFSR
ncbi:glyoxalase [Streptacidiphilus pinicola]|uniref:Glyoxalase n=1 Tax=Streptacidiphilus pinicola TaxID=2219663 RepID=A0A2X0I824_9ACTN|nr:VOC family protein [Streptacidiphilus pinicola]RAG81082.1 glyoxalase [Streptacidiphilus pinicola]